MWLDINNTQQKLKQEQKLKYKKNLRQQEEYTVTYARCDIVYTHDFILIHITLK